MSTKATSLRLEEDQAAELAAVARADGVNVSEAVRQAIAEHVETRRSDRDFQERLRRVLEEDRERLERLRGE
jgi:post-segregation antitoxin (ccd killing protein)